MARRVVVIGAGAVGSTYAYALLQSGVSEEIVLVDQNRELALGQAMDLAHGLAFVPAARVRAGEMADLADADLVVVTAGAKQKPGQTRLDLLRTNEAVMDSIADALLKHCPGPVPVIVVTNPVDIMTYVLLERTGWPRNLVFGSGTVLDSARFRYLLSSHCGINPQNVHAYVLGEHGDSEVLAWSLTHVAGIPIEQYCPQCFRCPEGWEGMRERLSEAVRNSAYHIIDYKGATWFAVSLALVRITQSVLRNERSVLTVSVRLEGEYGLREVALSVPCVVSARGAEEIIQVKLSPEEERALHNSAAILQAGLRELGLLA
ncbi:MAG: L-lactate dehydrogenase [candidate division KSB1 bacterium]|nr:L-lactate dehydrogenase [candidate division KSB1 bacterium]